jgi:hypothetical protein
MTGCDGFLSSNRTNDSTPERHRHPVCLFGTEESTATESHNIKSRGDGVERTAVELLCLQLSQLSDSISEPIHLVFPQLIDTTSWLPPETDNDAMWSARQMDGSLDQPVSGLDKSAGQLDLAANRSISRWSYLFSLHDNWSRGLYLAIATCEEFCLGFYHTRLLLCRSYSFLFHLQITYLSRYTARLACFRVFPLPRIVEQI